ncbi:MAG: hypothetical protein JKX72_09730 [Robiginitomaculum sp.]|nr:hypothetical protein [Robiginitomaculum sp.]
MDTNLPAKIPSLAKAFEGERENLRNLISSQDLSAAQSVLEARRALDRTGEIYAHNTQDVHLQKAGLWLLEMVKSGAGVLDQGVSAEVVWKEIPNTSIRVIAGSTLFYSAAMVFFIAGYIQASRLTMVATLALVIFRFFDPKDWKHYLRKIPFWDAKKHLFLKRQ